MSSTLKNELGLGEPVPADGANGFREAFQAELDGINEHLRFTAAYAAPPAHEQAAAKRDTVCSAYQAALAQIDADNPVGDAGATDKVLSAALGLRASIETLKTTAEARFNDWSAAEAEFDEISDQVRAMVESGHEKGAALQEICDKISQTTKERRYDVALQALEQLRPKFASLQEEFEREKEAQEQTELNEGALEPDVAAASGGDSPPTEVMSAKDDGVAESLEADELTSEVRSLDRNEGTHQAGVIYFATDSEDLGADDHRVLDSIKAFYGNVLAGLHTVAFSVDGFADDRGDAGYNQKLSERRAEAVASQLTSALSGHDGYEIETKGWGEEPAGSNDTPEQRALGRRADIVVKVTTYDPEGERQEAAKDLPGMIDQAIPLLEGTSSEWDARTVRLMEKLRQPGIDDAYLDQGDVRKYVLQEMFHEGIQPDDLASHALTEALNQVRYANGDPQKFVEGMRHLSEGIFQGIEETNRLYKINGEEYMSAQVLFNWAMERQQDSGSILSAHQR